MLLDGKVFLTVVCTATLVFAEFLSANDKHVLYNLGTRIKYILSSLLCRALKIFILIETSINDTFALVLQVLCSS